MFDGERFGMNASAAYNLAFAAAAAVARKQVSKYPIKQIAKKASRKVSTLARKYVMRLFLRSSK